MYGECLEGVLKFLDGVWICLEVVCNVLKGVLKVSEGFPFDVVRCPHLNCSPINKQILTRGKGIIKGRYLDIGATLWA